MAQPSGTFSSYDAVGNREDLENDIYNVDPVETPVMSAIGRINATARLHEWQTQALAAAAQNAQIEGDTFANGTRTATARVSNYTQIATKVIEVTGTQQAVDPAGRGNEMGYQLMLAGKELKRDMENDILSNQAPEGGNDTTARTLRPLPGWYVTNVNRGSGGANGSSSTAATDGTQRAFTEDLLKDVAKKCWDAGGKPTLLVTGSFNRQIFSTFTGGNNRMQTMNDKGVVNTAIRVYDGDFGMYTAVADHFVRARDCHLIQPDMLALAFLRTFRVEKLPKTADSERNALVTEYTLVNRNEKAHGIVADLLTA